MGIFGWSYPPGAENDPPMKGLDPKAHHHQRGSARWTWGALFLSHTGGASDDYDRPSVASSQGTRTGRQ
jgi:hypothetical protein